MKTNLIKIAFVFVLAGLMCVPIAQAQKVNGSITGTITDSSDAVVPGAAIVAHNVDTGVDTPATTNASGVYHIESLPIGRYQVTITAAGFKTETVPPFDLEALQSPTFNIKMSVGGGSATVAVSAAAPILNTNDASIESTFTANTIENMPLNGLDFSALTLYVPGSVSTFGTTGTTSIERSTYYSDTVNLNGNRAQANNFTLEGIDLNETFNNLISYSPAPDSLGEVTVLTANSPVDLGNVNGGGVVSVLKSGTNRFHGSAYGYVQDYRLNANSWQNDNQGIKINPYSQDQFGGTLGGPIKRDKLFFFVDYLGSRHHVGGIGTASVFTQAMRNGDFSVLLAQGKNSKQLYDTLNNYAPYANDQGIPIVNPVATFLFANPSLYPLPNATPTDGIAANDYQAPQRTFSANNQGDIKIDFNPNSKDRISGFYSMSTAYNGVTPVLAISFSGPTIYPTKLFGTNWVHTFSPSLINSARIGFTRTVWEQNFSVDSTGKFGDSGDSKVGISFPDQSFAGYSSQSISGGITAGGNPVYGGGLIDNTYSYIDSLTWQRAKHLLTIGGQALRYQNNYPTANNYGYLGSLGYSGDYTFNPADTNSGYGGADFLLDRVTSVQATSASVNVGQRQWRAAWFINDDFKATPKLTLNFGLRYEVDEPWVESNNKTGNVDETTGQVLYAHHVPVGAPPGSGYCSNRGCYDWNFRQFLPHIGFAYQAANNFVVRGGYGATSFFEGNSSNQRLTSITPFIQALNFSLNQPALNTPVVAPLNAQTAFNETFSGGGSYNVYPKNIQPAYVQEWNLTTEFALTHALSLQAGYIGEQGQHIEDYGNINQYLVNGDSTSAPFYNSPYIGVNSNQATAVNSSPLLVTESRAMMNYNALQVVLRQRQSHGLEFTVNYTYGKAMTNSLGNYALNVNGYNGAFENYYNSGADYGPAGYDIRHNLTATGVYALPVGHGQLYLSGANRALDEVIGGWKLSTTVLAYSGFPESMTTNVSNLSQSYGTQRANQYRHMKIVHRSIYNWFGTDPSAQPCTTVDENNNPIDNGVCAFGIPKQGTFGTSRNGAVRGPGYLNTDLSAFKDFHLFGEHSVGFRFDAFNALNIVSYGNPDIGINDTSFGQIAQQNSIRSNSRTLQFSAHYRF
jgi:hypothetical protein